jgi:hypothetical protein
MKVLVEIPRNYDIENKAIIEVNEKLEKIQNFSSSFDYKNFLKTKDIFLVLKPINFQFLNSPPLIPHLSGEGNSIGQMIDLFN